MHRKRFHDIYAVGPPLGHGGLGSVREVVEKSTFKRFACKVIPKSDGVSEHDRERMQWEVKLSLELSRGCEGLVHHRHAFEEEGAVYLVMELCRGGTLSDYIIWRTKGEEELLRAHGRAGHAGPNPPAAPEIFRDREAIRRARRDRVEAEAGWILGELARAVAHCHELGVAHRDVNPENILLSNHIVAGHWIFGPPSKAVQQGNSACCNKSCPRHCLGAEGCGKAEDQSITRGAHRSSEHLLWEKLLRVGKVPRVGQDTTSESPTREPGTELKPQKLKLGNFGLAEHVGKDRTPGLGAVGNPAYVAPEVVRGQPAGLPADVWSLGVVLYFVLTDGELPFKGDSTSQLLKSIRRGEVDWACPALHGVSPMAKGVLRCLLASDPAQRPTAAEVVQMPWVQEQLQKGHLRGHGMQTGQC